MRRGNAKPCRAAPCQRSPATQERASSARARSARSAVPKDRRESEAFAAAHDESRLSAEKAGLVLLPGRKRSFRPGFYFLLQASAFHVGP